MLILTLFLFLFAGELAEAFRSRTDVHFGIYFSLFEWFHPLLLLDQQNGYKTREYPKVSTSSLARSSHRSCSVKKGILKNCANFTGLYWSATVKAFNFIKQRLQHRCFPVKFVKFLRTAILKNI